MREGDVDMDGIIETLKMAEERADEVEGEAHAKASMLLKKAEAESKRIEGEVESNAKASGEALLQSKLGAARVESERIRNAGKKDAKLLEERVSKNLEKCVLETTDAIIKMVKGE
mgnify:CR=1 FL=1